MKYRPLIVALLGLLSLLIGTVSSAQASHFRFGHLTWKHVSGNTVEFEHVIGMRNFAPFVVGNTSQLTTVNFGDGSPMFSPTFTVFFVSGSDTQRDWFLARATYTHTYPSPGPFVAADDSCCRQIPLQHVNNPNQPWRVEATIDLRGGNTGNPKSLLPAIVDCPQNAVCRFQVVASDRDNQGLRWRLSSPAEAGGFFRQPGPPFAPNTATIDLHTGIYTWDATDATLNPDRETLYSTQVTIEDMDTTGTIVSKSAIDFFIRLVSPEEVVSENVIKVPVRWCSVRGVFREEEIDEEIQKRLNCMNDNIFLPQETKLQFVSGLQSTSVSSFKEFVVEDPDPAIGNAGDIVDQDGNGDGNVGSGEGEEFWSVHNQCRKLWEEKAQQGTGIVAVVVNRFLKNTGSEADTLGRGGVGCQSKDAAAQLICNAVWVAKDASTCNSALSFFHNTGKVLGQEFAHDLALGHGDGEDDDNDGDLDEDADVCPKNANTNTSECPDGPSPHNGRYPKIQTTFL